MSQPELAVFSRKKNLDIKIKTLDIEIIGPKKGEIVNTVYYSF